MLIESHDICIIPKICMSTLLIVASFLPWFCRRSICVYVYLLSHSNVNCLSLLLYRKVYIHSRNISTVRLKRCKEMEHKLNLVEQNDDLFPMIRLFLFLIAIFKQMCNIQKSVPISEEMSIPAFQVLYLIIP